MAPLVGERAGGWPAGQAHAGDVSEACAEDRGSEANAEGVDTGNAATGDDESVADDERGKSEAEQGHHMAESHCA